jgi:hypothetical protein
MAHEAAAKQFSFRLSDSLVQRVEQCREGLQATGLEVNRADVVRLLLKHALNATHCDHRALLGEGPPRKRSRRKH